MINQYGAVGGMEIGERNKITQRKIKFSYKLLGLLVSSCILDIIHPLGFSTNMFRRRSFTSSSKTGNLI
jgi:hypothetical protein